MKRLLRLLLITIAVLAPVCASFAAEVSSDADKEKLFVNGSIYKDAYHKVDNLLVKNGVVIGHNVNPKKHPEAEIIDLKGAAAYPGFNDSHIHLEETGLVLYVGVDTIGCNGSDDLAKKIEEFIKNKPDVKILTGAGFSVRDYNKWSLDDLAKLDKATGDRPTFIVDKFGHNAVINSYTMKLLGITPATKVPLGGVMVMENGKLTGMLRESAMILPSTKIYAMFSNEDVKAGTTIMAKNWASMGYTGVVDLMGAPGIRIMHPDVFKEMEKEGSLPLRINYCYTIFNLKDVDDAAKYRGQDTDLVRFVGCKIFVDGAYAGGQAWTSWKNNQGTYGLQEIYTDDKGGPDLNLNRIVAKVEEYGMNMHYHVQGDKAISAVLDALDKVLKKNGKIKGIHTFIHCAFPTDAQLARMKKFKGHAVITTQPGFWPVEENSDYYYGDKAKTCYPVKKMIDSGLSVGMSTDFSVSPPEYTPATVVIGVAATGGGDPKNHPPVSVREMVKGFGVGSNATTGKKDTGTLDIGKKADIVVFDQDLYSVPPEKINAGNPKVLATYVSGKKAYEIKKP